MPSDMNSILKQARTIAVVGMSNKPERDSFMVGKYMMDKGYTVIPVRPGGGDILGQPVFATLADVKSPIDIVDVFRNSEDALGVVEESVRLSPKPKAIWLQFGVVNEKARSLAEQHGIPIFMDHCLKVDHANMGG